MPRHSLLRTLLVSFVAAAFCAAVVLLSGCGGSDQKPISSKSSKFEAGDDGASSRPPASGVGGQNGGIGQQPAGSRPKGSSQSSTNVDPVGGASNPQKPPSVPAEDFAAETDGQSDEVKAVMKELFDLERRQPQGTTRSEAMENFKQIQEARVAAAEKLMDMQTDDKTQVVAAQSKLDGLRVLMQLGVESAGERMSTYCETLKKSKIAELARTGRMLSYGMRVGEYAAAESDKKNYEPLREELKALLEEADTDAEAIFDLTEHAASQLYAGGYLAEASEAMLLIAEAFRESKTEGLAQDAQQLRQQGRIIEIQARFEELDIHSKMQSLAIGERDSQAPVLDAIKTVLADDEVDDTLFQMMMQMTRYMEIVGSYQAASETYALVGEAYKDHADEKLKERVVKSVENGTRRSELVGKSFSVEGVTPDGKPFDWSAYKGKIVLIDFWATWCGPCLAELPNILKNYEKFHAQGFDVVGVNLDDSREEVDRFLETQKLPWTTVLSSDAEATGFDNPMAVRCGVDAIPFIVLVDREGVAVALHARGELLDQKLEQLFKPVDKTGGDSPKKDAPSGDKSGSAQPRRGSHGDAFRESFGPTYFVAFADEDEPATAAADDNPYIAPARYTTAELVEFLLDMRERPRDIQRRPGFADAVVDAADRVLADDPKPAFQRIAVLSKFWALHHDASWGNEKSDEKLVKFLEQMKDSQDKRTAKEVQFLTLERKAINADALALEQIPALLDELKKFFSEEELTERHLRMASSTVRAINRLDSEDEEKKAEYGDMREKYFAEFGNLFAKSSDRELVAYGKKLAKPPASGGSSDLVGKPLELAGSTADGMQFDWTAYRGKVVLVDFWATWCGPCRREMPHVKALFEKHNATGFEVVGVSLDKDLGALSAYIKENAIPWENLAGEETQELASKYGVRGIPTMMLVDREGKIVAVSHNVAALIGQAEKLLAAPANAPAKTE